MANFTETDVFPATVYILDILDPALGGTANSKANVQARDLTNRTRWLYNRVNKLFFYLNIGSITGLGNGVANINGSSYTLPFPLASPDYTTPNDGVTRSYEITLSASNVVFSGSVTNAYVNLYTTTGALVFSLIMDVRGAVSQSSICLQKIASIGPNVALKVSVGVSATGGGTVDFTNISVQLKEI